MQKSVIVASKIASLANIINNIDGFDVITTTSSKDRLISTCKQYAPDILVISEGLDSARNIPTVNFLLAFHNELPNIRIIYLAGQVNMDNIAKVTGLASLVEAGIYDIYHEKKLSKSILIELLTLPKTKKEVCYLLQYSETENDDDFEFEDDFYESDDNNAIEGKDNVYVVSSIKPGTGKSFVATNLSTAIAKFGKMRREDGKIPRVALIEGDLQNLSIGTLLQIENDKMNIKTALEAIAKIVDENGNIYGSEIEQQKVNEYIIKCFQPYYHAKNLYALVGSQIRMEDMENVSPYHYYYLVEVVSNYFDVVIIDSNSSLQHVTTLPILQLAKTCYYIINLDFNNVRNNARYKLTLESLDLAPKLKYILNEDIGKENKFAEKLQFDADMLDEAGFHPEAKIPTIDKSIFLNRLYEGKAIVLDNTPYTLEAREEICKVANQIWPLNNLDELRMERDYRMRSKDMGNRKKKKGLFGGIFK